MARRVVLIVCSDSERLQSWHRVVRRAGYLLLSAATTSRALYLLHKIRPALVLADARLSDGRAPTLLYHMRAMPPLERVPVLIIGALTPEEQRLLARDPYVEARQGGQDAVEPLLEDILTSPLLRQS